MGLDDYIKQDGALNALAAALGCHPAQIRQWKSTAKTKRMPGAAYCVSIEKHTAGAVTRQELRPDWQAIWPELTHGN
jgi:DNA-binding transcriptional regulator YdaS (Cro superfamily)